MLLWGFEYNPLCDHCRAGDCTGHYREVVTEKGGVVDLERDPQVLPHDFDPPADPMYCQVCGLIAGSPCHRGEGVNF